jgi:hypothetical protein
MLDGTPWRATSLDDHATDADELPEQNVPAWESYQAQENSGHPERGSRCDSD